MVDINAIGQIAKVLHPAEPGWPIRQRYDDPADRKRLKDIVELRLPPSPDSEPDHFDIFQNYEIEAEDRDGLKAHLQDRGIGTIIQWGGYTIHQFEKLGLGGNVPYTERMTQRYLLLPMNVSVDDEAVAYIGDTIARFYRRENA